jgi:hypothetical protein
LDGGDEPVPTLGNSLDVARFIPRVFQHFAQQGNVPGQGPFFDKSVRPDGLHQIALVHHPAGAVQQYEQGIEGFRRQGNQILSAMQEPLLGTDAVGAKPILDLRLRHFECYEDIRSELPKLMRNQELSGLDQTFIRVCAGLMHVFDLKIVA